MNKRISATEDQLFNLNLKTGDDENIGISFESKLTDSSANTPPTPPRPDSTSPFASVDIKQIQALATLLNFHNNSETRPFLYQSKPKRNGSQHPC